MASVFEVLPYDGGWCVKIADTGEVLFFSARRRAIAEAEALARAWPCAATVRVRPRRATVVEAWTPAASDFAYPLGVPA
ncbi:hypothetical protein [Caulobacter sp. 1776]|uniref:hypothetical protein n=1 Tax=Caulobacter sp. 1776 TaxID=3156420 RepID=UPI00339B0F27